MKNFIWIVFIITLFPILAADDTYLGVEIVCSQPLKNIELSQLCIGEQEKNCDWKIQEKSETAKSWKKGNDIRVTEIRRKEALKVFLYNPNSFFEIKTPWCVNLAKLFLPQEIRKVVKVLKEKKEILYLLSTKDTEHLPRLKSIKHPCRKLTKVPYTKAYDFYFLMPQPLKSCP